jgi:starvation-inducible outer membrane lipoprotein
MAIGGETDPYGYILVGDDGFRRLYLAIDGDLRHSSLKAYRGQYVRVSGTLGSRSAGGVETPRRTFPVLNVTGIGSSSD